MEKYIKIYDMGMYQGLIDAYDDFIKDRKKVFKKIDDILIKSMLYDIGYIKGYNIFFNIVKNNSI